MSSQDAESVLKEVTQVNATILSHKIIAMKVNLNTACKSISTEPTPGNADGFVLHSPNEVLEFTNDRLSKPTELK